MEQRQAETGFQCRNARAQLLRRFPFAQSFGSFERAKYHVRAETALWNPRDSSAAPLQRRLFFGSAWKTYSVERCEARA